MTDGVRAHMNQNWIITVKNAMYVTTSSVSWGFGWYNNLQYLRQLNVTQTCSNVHLVGHAPQTNTFLVARLQPLRGKESISFAYSGCTHLRYRPKSRQERTKSSSQTELWGCKIAYVTLHLYTIKPQARHA